MNKKVLIISVCVIICLTGLIYAYTTPKDNKPANVNISTPENTTHENIQENKEQTNKINSGKDNDVIATQKGPNESQKRGTHVPIYCSITNRGRNAIYDVNAGSQSFKNCNKNFGTLKPGESKKFIYIEYIPTDSEMEEDMPGSGPLPNPYYIGGFLINFKDANGVVHTMTSNPIEVKWYN